MNPSYGRRAPMQRIDETEDEYVPRSDEGKSIINKQPSEDFGNPASIEDINKAFAISNASKLLLDEVSNGKIGRTFKDDEAYNVNILPMSTTTNEASLEEDWCEMNIDSREQVGQYKDRLGRTIPILVEKIPPKQFSEPQVTKATRNMEVFTGIIPQKKKTETKGFISEREEHPLTRYMNAASKTLERQKNDLSTNSTHVQSFTQKDTCRDGYHGYNMTDGHDKRARRLVDTNRNHYTNYVVPSKGIDEDGQVPYVAEKTTKKEVEKFKRSLAVGEGGYNDNLIKKSLPILSSAKLVVEGRTGGSSSVVDNLNIKPLKHRIIKEEVNKFLSEHGQKNFDHASAIKGEIVPTNRNVLPQNTLRQKSFETGIALRSQKVSAMNMRDATFVEGFDAPSMEECNIRSEQERDLSEEDSELEAILIQQTLDECRIHPEIIMNKDTATELVDIYGEKGPDAMLEHSGILPSHRMPETSVENNILEPGYGIDPTCERPKQILGDLDAVTNETLLVESNFRQGRVCGPKERKFINKSTKNREATVNESNVLSENIRSEKRLINSYGAQNIRDFQDARKFHEFQKPDISNVVIGSSDDVEMSRMGFIKGFMQTINQILPGRQEKEQLVSGLEQTKLPTGHLVNGSELPMLSGDKVLKEEIVQKQRMASSHAPFHVNTGYNMVKSHAKRGLDNTDRLSSLANGKRGVARDAWISSTSESKSSGRAEYYRPPSAMSDTGSLCVPEMENKKDANPQYSIRC
tara:strand:+ start:2703 stop:4949 length:2247 start_codon:yes stop_codon:yes gene_type:complete